MLIPLQQWGSELPVQYSSNLAIAMFVFFSLLMVAIGVYAARFQDSEEDYYIGGRRSGVWVIALSGFAAIQSGWGLVGNPGSIQAAGIAIIVWLLFSPVGFAMGYWLLARKMRMLGDVKNVITAPDAAYHRYKDDRLRLLTAISVFLGCIGYLAAQYAALGIIGALILPVGFFPALMIGFVVVGIYTTLGGMLAALWSDAIQGAMMIVSALLVGWYLFTGYPGGFANAMSTVASESPEYFGLSLLGMDSILPIGVGLSLLVIVVTIPAMPQFMTKFYMSRNTSVLKWGALISGGGYLITTLFWFTGPVMRAATIDGIIDLPTADATMPLALIEFAPPLVVGFALVSVVAAIMSTSNAFLNLGAASIMHDIVGEYMDKDLTDEQEVMWGRVTTGVVLLGAFALAATSGSLILVIGAAGWAIFASVIFPAVVIGYNWRGATAEGALWGGGTALVLTLALAYGGQYGLVSIPLGFFGGQLANLLGVVVFVVVSLVTNTNTYDDLDDEDVKWVMDIPRLNGSPEDSRDSPRPADD